MALNSSSSLTTAKIRRFFEPYKQCDCKHIHTVQAPSLQTRLLRGSLLRVENENESSRRVLTTKLRVEIENETRVLLESVNFEIKKQRSVEN